MITASLSHSVLASSTTMFSPVQAAPTGAPTAEIFVTPNSIADLSKTSGPITFGLNVSHSDQINQFTVSITYNPKVLAGCDVDVTCPKIDYSGNILGSGAQVGNECIDGKTEGGPCLPSIDHPGVITFSLYVLGGGLTPVDTSGRLFRVTFTVIGVGFSQIHIQYQTLSNGVANVSVPATTSDGYFTNSACPSSGNTPCKPMVVSFTNYPTIPSWGVLVNFTAHVADSNTGAHLQLYTWEWGDQSGPQNQNTTGLSRIGTDMQHVFGCGATCFGARAQLLDYTVTLTVQNDEGVAWTVTQNVHIYVLFIDLLVGQITVSQRINIYAGTPVAVSAVIQNNSTLPEKASIIITVDGKQIGGNSSGTFNLGPRGGNRTQGWPNATLGPKIWNTTGLPPRVYEIHVHIPIITGENITSNNDQSIFVQLVIPQILGAFSLSLFQTVGLGVLVLVGLGFGLTRLLRKPSYLTEPLEAPKQ